MNLRHLTDFTLISETEKIAKCERELLTQMLHHLREIESRKLYSALGFSSLFDFATKKLGYSEDQAYRRINAMRLLKSLPEIENKINSGAMTLSNLSLAQSFFKSSEKQDEALEDKEKLDFLKKLENKSSRDAEKIIASENPEIEKPKDKIKPITKTKVRFDFVGSEALQEKVEKLKALLAHSHPNLSMERLFEMLCDLGLEKFDPLKKKEKTEKNKMRSREKAPPFRPSEPQKKQAAQEVALDVPETGCQKSGEKGEGGRRKYISVHLKRKIWSRDQGRCCNCQSDFALEVDHIEPVSLGGESTEKNLRLLCRNCNHRSAIEKLGLDKMQKYF